MLTTLALILPSLWLASIAFFVILCKAAAGGDAQGGEAAYGASRPSPPHSTPAPVAAGAGG